MTLPRLSIALAALLLAETPVVAQQYYDRPPAGFQDDGPGQGPVDQPDGVGLAIRVGKLESRLRDMTGQIEELQNANRKLIEQVTRFQADVDSRLSNGAPRAKRSEAAPTPGDSPAVTAEAGAIPVRKHRDDAFDPDAAPATDPGRPKPLGATQAGRPIDDSSAPMDLAGGKLRREATEPASDTLAPTLRLPSSTAPGSNSTAAPNAGVAAPQSDYEIALGLYRDKQYENAERSFAAFIEKNPKSKRVADATYYLGESYSQRGRSREAAEQYLKVYTEYASSARAPDAMLHLGLSLKALGAKEQACAAFSEIPHKFPNAPNYVRSGAEREAKRAQCAS